MPIFQKRSLTSGSIPTTSNLLVGELAINVPDGRIFLRKSGSGGADTIESAITTNSPNTGSVTLSGSITVTGSINAISFTGSLFGTSSWAQSASVAISSSFASTASFVTNALSASFASTASSADNFTVRGTLTAQTIVAQTITSSTNFVTGSTRFGSLITNTHQFTGSVNITGSLTVTGSLNAGTITGSLFGTSSWAQSASIAITASFWSGSIINALSASFASTASLALSVSGGATNYIPLWRGANTISSSIIYQDPTSNNILIGTTTDTGQRFNVNGNIRFGSAVTDNHDITGSLRIFGTGSGGFNNIIGTTTNVGDISSTQFGFGNISSRIFISMQRQSYVQNIAIATIADKAYINLTSGNSDRGFEIGNGSPFGDSRVGYIANFNTTGSNAGAIDFRVQGSGSANNAMRIFTETRDILVADGALTDTGFKFEVSGSGPSGSVRFRNGLLITGSLNISGSVTASIFSGSFTGSLFGTSSWAQSASFAVSAAWAPSTAGGGAPGGSDTQLQYRVNSTTFGGVSTATFDGTTLRATGSFSGSLTGSLFGTSSWAQSASIAITASFWSGSIIDALSASFASTASFINTLRQTVTITGSVNITGSTTINGTASIQDTLTVGTNTFTNRLNGSFGTIGIQSFSVNNAWFGDNMFWNGSNFVRRAAGFAGMFLFYGNEGQFRFGTNSTAGSIINNGTNGFGAVTLKTNLDGTFAVGSDLNNAVGVYTNAGLIMFGSTRNVGINTTTDAGFRLDVNGSTRIIGTLLASSPTAFVATGSVFITGSTTITGSLLVSGSITGSLFGTSSWAQSASNAVSAAWAPAPSNTFVQGGNSFGAVATLGTNDLFDLKFETNATDRVFISSSGAVGIATNTPTGGRLHIVGTGTAGENAIFINRGANGNSIFGTNGLYFETDNTFDFGRSTARTFNINAANGTTNTINIDTNSNMAIGANTPTAGFRLDVRGNTRIAGNIFISSSISTPAMIVTGSVNITGSTSVSGALRLPLYVSTTSFPGTAAGYLAFNTSGDIITVAGTSGGGNNVNNPSTGRVLFSGPTSADVSASAFFNYVTGSGIRELQITGTLNTSGGYINGVNIGGNITRVFVGGLTEYTTGSSLTIVGYGAGYFMSGSNNTGIGKDALSFSSGSSNIALGDGAGVSSTGSFNVYAGRDTGFATSGSNNVFVGYNIGQNASGSNNVFIGSGVGGNLKISSSLLIGNSTNILVQGNFTNRTFGISGSLFVTGSPQINTTSSRFVVIEPSTGQIGFTTGSSRVSASASPTTITPNVDDFNLFTVTALANSLTINNPISSSLSPLEDGRKLMFRIRDNGVSRTITTGSRYRASTDLSMPSTTTAGRTLYLGFMYNSSGSTSWDLIAKLDNF